MSQYVIVSGWTTATDDELLFNPTWKILLALPRRWLIISSFCSCNLSCRYASIISIQSWMEYLSSLSPLCMGGSIMSGLTTRLTLESQPMVVSCASTRAKLVHGGCCWVIVGWLASSQLAIDSPIWLPNAPMRTHSSWAVSSLLTAGVENKGSSGGVSVKSSGLKGSSLVHTVALLRTTPSVLNKPLPYSTTGLNIVKVFWPLPAISHRMSEWKKKWNYLKNQLHRSHRKLLMQNNLCNQYYSFC